MAAHHPDEESLLAYAAGSLTEPSALLVATHLALCPGCRTEVGRYDALGGALLEDLPPADIAASCLAAVLDRLDYENGADPVRAPAPAEATDAGLPRPLRDYVAGGLDRLRWRWAMPGLRMADLGLGRPPTRTRLMRARAGMTIPRHGHAGTETLLVLAGGFTDERGHCRRGDVWISDATVTHEQAIDPDEGCLCLAVTEGPVRLTGLVGRALGRFARL